MRTYGPDLSAFRFLRGHGRVLWGPATAQSAQLDHGHEQGMKYGVWVAVSLLVSHTRMHEEDEVTATPGCTGQG